ncbi:MAG: ferritin family protein [Candidatus Cloacimonetes bacterium]|nr:ferritin family protein [Candidatus Cloacimonadota bacterium]NLO11085.1 ferritin family protein [Candidatus Cloacimonadota bacterium]
MSIKETLIDSIKKAMQGEMDSVTLYQNAADHTPDEEVKQFFLSRRDEEKLHYNFLLKQYQDLANDREPGDMIAEMKAHEEKHPMFTENFIKRIGQDQYLFSAISTALLLEKNAIDHYRKSAADTEIATLRAFFKFLEEWETVHYNDLLAIQKDAEQHYWDINKFEPF